MIVLDIQVEDALIEVNHSNKLLAVGAPQPDSFHGLVPFGSGYPAPYVEPGSLRPRSMIGRSRPRSALPDSPLGISARRAWLRRRLNGCSRSGMELPTRLPIASLGDEAGLDVLLRVLAKPPQ